MGETRTLANRTAGWFGLRCKLRRQAFLPHHPSAHRRWSIAILYDHKPRDNKREQKGQREQNKEHTREPKTKREAERLSRK